jgi:hypothetical protein
MPKPKKLHSAEGARRRLKKPNSEQAPQIPSTSLDLLEALNSGQDGDLPSRIEYHQRMEQEVDKYYEYQLFVGEGKQAIKRAHEYMRIQHEIFERMSEDFQELLCRRQLRNDIVLLTQMQVAEPHARIVENPKGTMAAMKHVSKGEGANENSDEDARMRLVMSTLLESFKAGKGTFKNAPERDKDPSVRGDKK